MPRRPARKLSPTAKHCDAFSRDDAVNPLTGKGIGPSSPIRAELARGSPAVQQGKPTLAAIAALDARLAASAGAVPRTETERVVLRLLVAALTRRDGQEPLRKFELFAVLHALDRAQAAAAAWRAAALAAGVTTAPGVPHEPLSWHADAGSDMTVASLHTALRQRAVEGIAGRDRY